MQEGGIHERGDVDRRSARKVRCRTGGMQDRRDAGQEGFRTGVIQVRCDAAKELLREKGIYKIRDLVL